MSITSPCLAELVIRTRISCSTSRIYFTLSLLFFSSLFLLLSLTFLPFFHERTVIRTQLNCCKMSGRLNVGRVVIHFFLSFFSFSFFTSDFFSRRIVVDFYLCVCASYAQGWSFEEAALFETVSIGKTTKRD